MGVYNLQYVLELLILFQFNESDLVCIVSYQFLSIGRYTVMKLILTVFYCGVKISVKLEVKTLLWDIPPDSHDRSVRTVESSRNYDG